MSSQKSFKIILMAFERDASAIHCSVEGTWHWPRMQRARMLVQLVKFQPVTGVIILSEAVVLHLHAKLRQDAFTAQEP